MADSHTPTILTRPKRAKLIRVSSFVASGMFWIWQITFLIVSLFGLLPHILPDIWISYQYYDMPLHYFVLGVALILLPLICLGVIAWLIAGGNSRNLILKFFYGFELPTLLLLSIYLLNMRDYGAGMRWVLITVGVAVCIWCAMVFYERISGQSKSILFANNPLITACSTIVFAVGIFVSVALLLFVIPLIVLFLVDILGELQWSWLNPLNILAAIASLDWREFLQMLFEPWIFIIMAAAALFMVSTALIFAMPFILSYLYIGQFITRFRHSFNTGTILIAATVVAFIVGIHFNANQQPQQSIFSLLESSPQTASDQQNLVNQSELIREGLLNAYLARYRYFSSTGSAKLLTKNYKKAFSLNDKLASYPQQLLNFLFTPILYDGDNRTDPAKAATLYEEFFDIPVQKAELVEIWRTLKHNDKSSAQNAAGLLDVSQESVYLASRSINVNVEQQLATISVTQKMVNKITRRREVIMHFSLPQHSVITGVWLSNDKNNLEQNKPLVAPRGAAQMVYNQQVSRQIDPALLEKVGPELYRLRVFPILSAKRNYQESGTIPRIIDGESMYVTFEYQTLANKEGSWPIPKLLEKRHLFWGVDTVNTINGAVVESNNNDDWLPLEAGLVNNVNPVPAQLPLSSGRTAWAVPSSYAQASSGAGTTPIPSNTIVLIDGSRSMSAHTHEVAAALAQVGDASIYFCQSSCKATTAVDHTSHVFYGNSKPIEQIESFLSVNDSKSIDRIILLTDDGSYEAESDKQEALLSNAAIWAVHLGGSKPYAYSDAWLTTVNQSGGGFSTAEISDLLLQLELIANPKQIRLNGIDTNTLTDHTLTGITADWLWFSGASSSISENDVFAKLGTAMHIAEVTKSGKALKLEQLDDLHLHAIREQIVTELSSMIVLVNEEQKKALEEAAKADDRFDRENEDGAQLVGVPDDSLSVAAVPEPSEWALLMVVLLIASISLYQQRPTTL